MTQCGLTRKQKVSGAGRGWPWMLVLWGTGACRLNYDLMSQVPFDEDSGLPTSVAGGSTGGYGAGGVTVNDGGAGGSSLAGAAGDMGIAGASSGVGIDGGSAGGG